MVNEGILYGIPSYFFCTISIVPRVGRHLHNSGDVILNVYIPHNGLRGIAVRPALWLKL